MDPQQQAAKEAADFVTKFNDIILFPTITLLSAVAFLVFVWGCVEYFIGAANESKRQEGVKHITYGIIGLVVMVSAYAILAIATATFALDDELECANNPTAAQCTNVFKIPDGGGGPVVPNSGGGGGPVVPGGGGGGGPVVP
ncbi:hypothetical protein H6781_01880 [Candidatus Nomurabacteria bacterium]|nr:hypothetical protein [Candidatus Kaiserbacteria bacterium]MCB9810323.1 hypothetical protein [Candidatus Nomurabacteria bacterium]MCB9818468.1 hypothetical protein [Candidatus Nomurabacteria bacterium]